MMTGLIDIVKEQRKPGLTICEVGCNDGETTMVYAPIIKECGGQIHVVDWFCGNLDAHIDSSSYENKHGYRPAEKDQLFVLDRFKTNLSIVNCLDIVTIHQGLSWEMAVDFEDESFDIVNIDADHRYSGVIKDIDAYLPKVKRGGVFCGHDFEGFGLLPRVTEENKEWQCWGGVGHMGVIQAIADRFPKDKIQQYSDSVWAYIKP